jgi:uncharacterized protein
MIHPHTKLVEINPVVGHGVVATRRIPRGTLTWVMDPLDRAIPEAELRGLGAAFAPLIDRWTFADGRGARVLCWDHGRYVTAVRPTAEAPSSVSRSRCAISSSASS